MSAEKKSDAGALTGSVLLASADLDQTLGFLLSMAQQDVFRDFEISFGSHGLTPRLYSILLLIEANPGCRLVDIGATLGVLQTNLVKRIDALVERGWVTRSPGLIDRRSKTLMLTPLGQERAVEFRAAHQKMEADLAQRIGAGEITQLNAALRRFVDIEKQNFALSPLGSED